MATRTTTSVFSNSSDANFRAWGSWLSGSFSAFGWSPVYSLFATGIDWTDVTTPAAANTARVTEVWAMADPLQATAPLFLKLEYGETATVDAPGFRIVVATGHSGSGNMTGILFDSGATYIGVGIVNANIMTHYASGDSARIIIAMGASGPSWASNGEFILSIERRKSNVGANQPTGFLYAHKTGTTMRSQGFLASAAHPFSSNSWNFPLLFTNVSDLTFENKIGVAAMLYCMGPVEMGANLVAKHTSNYPVGSDLTVTVLGAVRNYKSLQSTTMTVLGGTSITPAILYE